MNLIVCGGCLDFCFFCVFCWLTMKIHYALGEPWPELVGNDLDHLKAQSQAMIADRIWLLIMYAACLYLSISAGAHALVECIVWYSAR